MTHFNNQDPYDFLDSDFEIDTTKGESDFGFTFETSVTDADLQKVTDASKKEAEELRAELKLQQDITREIMKRITVLMTTLKQEPDKDIRWPNRIDSIDKFLSDLQKLYKREN